MRLGLSAKVAGGLKLIVQCINAYPAGAAGAAWAAKDIAVTPIPNALTKAIFNGAIARPPSLVEDDVRPIAAESETAPKGVRTARLAIYGL